MNDTEVLNRINMLREEIKNSHFDSARFNALNRELEKAVEEHNKLIVTNADGSPFAAQISVFNNLVAGMVIGLITVIVLDKCNVFSGISGVMWTFAGIVIFFVLFGGADKNAGKSMLYTYEKVKDADLSNSSISIPDGVFTADDLKNINNSVSYFRICCSLRDLVLAGKVKIVGKKAKIVGVSS